MPQSVPPFTSDLNVALRRVASLMAPNPELAEQQAREILKSYPAEANALTFLGAALRAQRKFEPARRALREAIERDPRQGLAHQEIGLTLFAEGRGEQATSAKNPELIKAADFLYEGRLAKAEAICREVLKKDPVTSEFKLCNPVA